MFTVNRCIQEKPKIFSIWGYFLLTLDSISIIMYIVTDEVTNTNISNYKKGRY